ncbi:hypothetical protein ACVWYN_001770 [Pedobacter sp. UYP24]
MITILSVVEEFYGRNGENALLYICLANDGFARNRHITFNKWFKYVANHGDYIREQTGEKEGLYCTLLLKKANPDRIKLIEAFHHTIRVYWGLN